MDEVRISRFWSRVDKSSPNGCWIWTAGQEAAGYGAFRISPNRMGKAHRIAWELTNGPIPVGLHACHKCDVRRCVNPDHIFLGTDQDNMSDMWAKGRAGKRAVGSEHWKTKLTEEIVKQMRAEYVPYKNGAPSLAKKFGISEAQAHKIVTRKFWKHV